MSSEKIVQLFHAAAEGQRRFDYFLTGVTGAILAYVAQTYTPRQLGLDYHLGEPAAIVLLALSFYFGVKRCENHAEVGRLNVDMLAAQDEASGMAKAIREGLTGFTPDGVKVSSQMLHERLMDKRAEAQVARAQIDRLQSRGQRAYRLRNFLLYSGFAALVAGKLLQPYS